MADSIGDARVVNFRLDFLHEFQRHKALAERAMARFSDDAFFQRPGEAVNSIALVVKHLAGNLRSRWTDFLTTDGEKPWRNRDDEFVITDADTREHLMKDWEVGWQTVLDTVGSLEPTDLDKSITIRGESQTVQQALLRGVTHVAYHVGQILYLARLLEPEGEWLTIAPGNSSTHLGEYRRGI